MKRYILRRLLQMAPTVLGVVVLTFVLFHMVGGSPASLALGKNASARALEEFDEQRGFNKPLLIGRWSPTRAYGGGGFDRDAGPWRGLEGVRHLPAAGRDPGRISLEAGREVAAPLAFGLRPDTEHQWRLRYRLPAGRALVRIESAQAEGAVRSRQTHVLPASARWRTASIPVAPGRAPAGLRTVLRAEGAGLELRSIELRRRNAHWLDTQFVFYLRQLARLDFGVSNFTNQRVSRMLRDGLGPSLCLTVPIFLVSLAVSVSLALVCAYFRNRWLDRSIVILAVGLMSVNYLVWIIFGQYYLAFRRGWFPIWGFESWTCLLLPVLIGVVSGLGENARFYRTLMLDELYRDYVRTAMAKGASPGRVLFVHVLKNAMIPILTHVVIAIPFLYTGSLLLEGFFGIPGLGSMGINAVNAADVDVIRALVLIGSILYVAANLMTDLCYALVDPRVKLG